VSRRVDSYATHPLLIEHPDLIFRRVRRPGRFFARRRRDRYHGMVRPDQQPHTENQPSPSDRSLQSSPTESDERDHDPAALSRRAKCSKVNVATASQRRAGRVDVTADHGNRSEEWGLYGHPMHAPVPALLAVPQAETIGDGHQSHTPTLDPPEPLTVTRIYGAETDRDRFGALGYSSLTGVVFSRTIPSARRVLPR